MRVLELLVVASDGISHVCGGTYRSEGVVLVGARNAEHGHHGVTDELLDGAAVPLDRRAHEVVVTRHDLSQRFGVELLSQRGRPSTSQKTIVTVLRTAAAGAGVAPSYSARRSIVG